MSAMAAFPGVDTSALDILIVDDTPEDIAVVRRQLRAQFHTRYEIREAASAAQGLELCRQQTPDCLLLDMRMPEADGLEFLDRLNRESGIAFPIIVFTRFSEDGVGHRAIQLGAQDYLVKGQTTPELLRRAIDHSRERFRTRKELAQANQRLTEANAELTRNLGQLEAIFSQTVVGIAQTNSEGRFSLANDRFCDLTGRTREALMNCRHGDVASTDDRQGTLYRHPDGSAVSVSENVSLIRDERGHPAGHIIVACDITESKAAERERWLLASIVEASADAIVSLDPDGSIRTWNRGAEMTFGYLAAEAVGKPFEMLVPADKIEHVAEVLREAANGRPVQGAEAIRLCKTGYRVPVAETFSAMRDGGGELVGFSSISRDIRARKRVEEKLKKSEAGYRTLANAMPQIVFTANVSGEIDFVNDQWTQVTGCPPGSALAFDWLDAIHPDDRDRSLRRWKHAVERGTAYESEHRLRYADGIYRWHLARAVPVTGAEGRITGWIGTCTDIELSKRSEIRLRESEARLNLAQTSAGVVVWDLDLLQNRYTSLPGFYDQFGFEPGAAYGFEDWLNRVHPEDREAILQTAQRSRTTGEPLEVEFRVNGSDRWLLGKGSTILDASGQAIRVTGVNIDITERKKQEAELTRGRDRLSFALNAARMGIWEWDLPSDTVDCSAELAQLFGVAGKPSPFGLETFLCRVDPAERVRVQQELREILHRGAPYAREFRIERPEGGWQWLELQGAAVRSPQGEPLRVIGTARDITEKKLLEEKLASAERFRSIGVMAAGLAHDFNNLLVNVIGSASLAREILPQDHKVGELLDQVVLAGERAASLTSQMLAYAGQGRFRDEVVDVSSAARQALRAVGNRFPTIQFTADIPDELTSRGDPGQVQEMIAHLLTNAAESHHVADYHKQATGNVWLRIEPREIDARYLAAVLKNGDIRPGRFLAIEVKDDGCGIPDSVKHKIFEPFFSTKFAGRGLGLAATAGIVVSHKGAIHLNSAEGAGTIVTVLLPSTPPHKSKPAAQISQAPTVLVVDDEETVALLATNTLKRAGYRTLEARNGRDALDLIRTRRDEISVVLLDLTMPVMGGREVLRHVRESYPDLPVILSSGYSVEEALARIDGEDIEGFLQKPYTSRALTEKVGEWVKSAVE